MPLSDSKDGKVYKWKVLNKYMDPAREIHINPESPYNSMGDRFEAYAKVSEMVLYLADYVWQHPTEQDTGLQLKKILERNPFNDSKSIGALTELLYHTITKKEEAEQQTNSPETVLQELNVLAEQYNTKQIRAEDASRALAELDERFTNLSLSTYFSKLSNLSILYSSKEVSPDEITLKLIELEDTRRKLADTFYTLHGDLEAACHEEIEFRL